jgi:hypothetical protein
MKGLRIDYVTMTDFTTGKDQRLWWFIDQQTGAEESRFSTKSEALACAKRIRAAYEADRRAGDTSDTGAAERMRII